MQQCRQAIISLRGPRPCRSRAYAFPGTLNRDECTGQESGLLREATKAKSIALRQCIMMSERALPVAYWPPLYAIHLHLGGSMWVRNISHRVKPRFRYPTADNGA